MELEVLGKAIAEALAARGKISNLEDKSNGLATQIEFNEKEITRLKSLEVSNEDLRTQKDKLCKEIGEIKAELDKRMEKLNKAGVSLPFDSSGAKRVSL